MTAVGVHKIQREMKPRAESCLEGKGILFSHSTDEVLLVVRTGHHILDLASCSIDEKTCKALELAHCKNGVMVDRMADIAFLGFLVSAKELLQFEISSCCLVKGTLHCLRGHGGTQRSFEVYAPILEKLRQSSSRTIRSTHKINFRPMTARMAHMSDGS
jgi:hypothetical protein